MIRVSDIIAMMERIAPASLAEPWDNPGLQLGNRNQAVERVMISLDPTPEVVKGACDRGVDLLITHHPLIFHALKQIDLNTPVGKMIGFAIQHSLAVFSAHTNLDSVSGGLNDVFAERLGLKEITDLCPSSDGLGRIGRLDRPMDLGGLSRDVKAKLGLDRVMVSGAFDLSVEQVAVCTGSGSSLMESFFQSDAQVFISGDLKYHDARDAEMQGRGLIDIGHFASERFMAEMVRDRLKAMLAETDHAVTVEAWTQDSDPFRYL
jgi:GTP cyclohydrolase I